MRTPSPSSLLALILSGLLVIPAVNVLAGIAGQGRDGSEQTLPYNVDVVKRIVARMLTPLGVSVSPQQVVIGKQQWLFMGDNLANTITDVRRPPTREDRAFAGRVAVAMAAWKDYLRSHGVRAFKILVGPNKTTIYPEHAADWMHSPQPTVMDAFLQDAGPAYIDVRKALLSAKARAPQAIYYRTDSHWNALGAGVAFRQLAQAVSAEAPEIRWPSESIYLPSGSRTIGGGDLSKFLLLTSVMQEDEPRIALQDIPDTIRQTDMDSGKVVYDGANVTLGMTATPIIVHNEDALNHRRVIWLRDSFGTALSPFMAHTFRDVLQLHWMIGLKPGQLASLVERFKPDYVFITVVERRARHELFAVMPPAPGQVLAPAGTQGVAGATANLLQ